MSYWVEIENAKELRKALLQSSKDLLSSLIETKKWAELKSEKLASTQELKAACDAMAVLFRKFRKALPKGLAPRLAPRPQAPPELPRPTFEKKLEEIEKRIAGL